MCLSVSSCCVHDIYHGNERGGSSGDNGRRRYRYQEPSHYYFHHPVEGVDGDGRGGYKSQTRTSPYHNPGDLVISLGLSVPGHEISVYRSLTSHLPLYNHGGIYIVHPMLPQEAMPRGS